MGNIESLIQVIANKPLILPRIILGRKVVVITALETSYASINLSFVLSAAISALNVANDSLLEEDSKAGRLVAFPLSLDPEETCQIKALVIPASREKKKKDLAKVQNKQMRMRITKKRTLLSLRNSHSINQD